MLRNALTERLLLVLLDPADKAMAEVVAAIEMDPRTRHHLPKARPLDGSQSMSVVAARV